VRFDDWIYQYDAVEPYAVNPCGEEWNMRIYAEQLQFPWSVLVAGEREIAAEAVDSAINRSAPSEAGVYDAFDQLEITLIMPIVEWFDAGDDLMIGAFRDVERGVELSRSVDLEVIAPTIYGDGSPGDPAAVVLYIDLHRWVPPCIVYAYAT